MIYIIDGNISYNSDDCTLSHLPTDEFLNLSIPSGRLFERLLNSDGEILAREVLLTEVWDKYGLRGSNSNLNQYLSMLRRALATYGCKNLIITIPKIGIRINTEIKVEKQRPPAIIVPPAVSDTSSGQLPARLADSDAEAPDAQRKLAVKHFRPAQSDIVITLFSLLLLAACGYYWLIIAAQRVIPSAAIKLPGGCEVVLLKGHSDIDRQTVEQQLLKIINENKQPCDARYRFYFDSNPSLSINNHGRTILSSCRLNNRGNIISCHNFYYLDWRKV